MILESVIAKADHYLEYIEHIIDVDVNCVANTVKMILTILVPVLIVTYLMKCWECWRREKKSVKGKHVCVTGGSSGIGKWVAILAAKQGANVTIMARNRGRLDQTIALLELNRANPGQIFRAVSVDCSDYETITETITKLDIERPIYMFVNCAGMALCGRLEEMSNDDVKRLMDVNYFGTVYPLQAIVPRMKTRNDGFVVITGSQGSLFGMYGYSIYSSTKFALRGLAEALHMELRDYNVSVTLSLPPDTDTPGYENENRSKPEETKIISQTAGLVDPEIVADKLIKDTLSGHFFSTVGMESWMLTNLCVGMSPFNYIFEVIVQTMVLGILRLVSSYYLTTFHDVVTRCYKKREEERLVFKKED